MRELLQRAITEVEKLPAETQDAIATRLLAEVTDEQEWSLRFESTTDTQWGELAAMARRSVSDGSTTPLEDLFQPKPPA
ncbi:MAG: hypothetical protein EXR58_05500 [Chloroflexi bacterium]|nr:hypothetical protein [Chloroflexota bacterium]